MIEIYCLFKALPLSMCVILIVWGRVRCLTTRTFDSSSHPCTTELLAFRHVLSPPTENMNLLNCFLKCVNDESCSASVYQISAGTRSCTALTQVSSTLTLTSQAVTWEESSTCHVILKDDCQNGGEMLYGVCACTDNFYGELCENSKTSSMPHREWVLVLTTSASSESDYIIHDSSIYPRIPLSEPKVKIRDSEHEVTKMISLMWATSFDGNPRLVSHLLLEKSSWNNLIAGGERMYRYFHFKGPTENVTLDGTVGGVSWPQVPLTFDVLATSVSPYTEEIPNDPTFDDYLREVLESGSRLSSCSFARDFGTVVVMQNAVTKVNLLSGKYFYQPPKWHNTKHILGENLWDQRQLIGQGIPYDTGLYESTPETLVVDRAWLLPELTTAEHKFSKARGYLMQGHQIRVLKGADYHDVVEVIRLGTEMLFLLRPYMTNSDPVAYEYEDDAVTKEMVTLSGKMDQCIHILESETILSHIETNGIDFHFSVDTQKWKPMYSVFSNTTVASGSLPDLAMSILSGSSVRLMIQWLNTDKDRFLDTQMNSVREDDKISSESTLTWRLADPNSPDTGFSGDCDLEYVMVTSDGLMQVATFNVWSPVVVREETDVLITWFVN